MSISVGHGKLNNAQSNENPRKHIKVSHVYRFFIIIERFSYMKFMFKLMERRI